MVNCSIATGLSFATEMVGFRYLGLTVQSGHVPGPNRACPRSPREDASRAFRTVDVIEQHGMAARMVAFAKAVTAIWLKQAARSAQSPQGRTEYRNLQQAI